jgi:MGT family glycosyltransferase
MSIGTAVDPTSLGPLPDNFAAAQYVPQLAVLEEADLFITHGGMNSINEAVMALVPMIVVPNTVEQAINAARIEQLQSGLYLEPERLTPKMLRTAAERILADPSLAEGLQRLRQSFIAGGGVTRAADAIATFKKAHQLD